MPDEMEEIIADFITEAIESLDRIDPLFVELEARGYDKDMINDIFRSMHTLKGAAGFLGFQSIVDVAHGAENIMKKLRENEIPNSKRIMDVILKSVDMLRVLIERVRTKEHGEEDTAPLLNELSETLRAAEQTGVDVQCSVAPESILDNAAPEHNTSGEMTPPRGGGAEGREPASPPNCSVEQGDKAAPEKKDSMQTLRVDINRIDNVMNLTGEVVLVRNRLLNIVNYLETKYSEDAYVESLLETVAFLDLVTSDMQLAVMRMRMQPIKKVFGKFPRLVRDIACSLGKEVELLISGEDTEVDKSVIEQIGDPMVHIIRNAIDHGLESAEARRAKGKPAKGTISISAYQKGNQIVIEVADDGKGIDVDRVKRKALEKKLITGEEAQ
ncbi:MAG: Hpt domain-containing protein, partial [Thermodesulfovibrionales bacterium]